MSTRRLIQRLLLLVVVMFAFGFALVPIYDVMCQAFAINGKVNSVEVYGSAALFAKLWPKLLRANALEAFIEQEKGKTYPTVSEAAVRAVLADAESGPAVTKDVSKQVRVHMRETPRTVLFETHDRARGTWVHRSYITK